MLTCNYSSINHVKMFPMVQFDMQGKKRACEELESIAKLKRAEADTCQFKSDDPRRDAEGLQQIVTEMPLAEYNSDIVSRTMEERVGSVSTYVGEMASCLGAVVRIRFPPRSPAWASVASHPRVQAPA